MTLDLTAVSRLVSEMARQLAEEARQGDERLSLALDILKNIPDIEALRRRLDSPRNFVGLAAGPFEPIDLQAPLPAIPKDYTVVASDGSLIEPDRHSPAYYFLINVSTVLLRYGQEPRAIMQNAPELGYRPEELYVSLGDREVPLQGGLLRIKRAIAETERLAALLVKVREDGMPLIGLQDGTLILWMPEGRGMDEGQLREVMLKPFLAELERLRTAELPIASYVSRPRSAEVANLLRVAVCPKAEVDCRRHCPQRSRKNPAECDKVGGVSDLQLFAALPLEPGQRSALFVHQSPVMAQYLDHRVHFFYLNVGAEIARVEVPEWVARDSGKLALVHALVYEQARRGGGYPRALTEAHEKAVIGVAEREQCERMIEAALVRHHMKVRYSEKQRSKRLRSV